MATTSTILLNKTELAASMGRNPSYISAMIRGGYMMAYGTKTTLAHALEWLSENPDFRVKHQYVRGVRGVRGDRAATAASRSLAPKR